MHQCTLCNPKYGIQKCIKVLQKWNSLLNTILINDCNLQIWAEVWFGLVGLWCLMPLSTKFHLYVGGQFYWWVNQSTGLKPPTCHKALTIFITMLYQVHLAISGIQTHNVVVIAQEVVNPTIIWSRLQWPWIELN